TEATAGMTVSPTGLVQWTPAAGVGSANVTVQVSDGGENGAAAATQSWTITVDDSNDAPTITSVAPTTAIEGSEYSYQLVVNDPDDANNGTDLSFSLTQAPSGMSISATGLVTWTPGNGISSADVTVQVADGGENGAAPATQSWTITVDGVNDAPVITEGDSIGVSMSEDGTPTAFALMLNATDIDSSTLTWSVATAATNGTAVASGTGNSKAIQYTPNANYVGSDSFVVRVSDGELSDDITVNVTISNENDAPVITSAAVTAASEDVAYQYGVTADDIDGDTLSWSLTQAPAGMNIDAATGVISWTPTENGASDWNADVTVQVSDGSLTDTQSFSISVAAINDAPLISSSPSTSGIEGEQYSYQIAVIDPDDSNNGTDISFTLVQGPAGMAISATGLLTWTPAQGDTSANVEISVADGGENGAAAATQNWTITIDATNDAPTITSVAPTSATEGSEYSYQLAITDPDDANNGTDLTFTLTQAPSGMNVSATGLVTWTPANGISSADVTVQVADGGEGGVGPATQSWTITVEGVNDAPVIAEGNSVNVSMSEDGAPTAFALTLNATDIDSSTLTWSILT
ncbi:MAG: tandem-95 repeat protein, partial [Alcanivoracaceae bacterium]|nr:tandem-95 repeat protein [Alcanivoracaceae bacterium]